MMRISRLLRPAATALIGLSMTFAMTGVASASPGRDFTSVSFIDGWSSAGGNALIIHTLGHDFRAELQPGCSGLDFSIGVRFIPSGRFNGQFDRFGHILLQDGTRCYLKSFVEIPRVKR
jgi:hypothetical protein